MDNFFDRYNIFKQNVAKIFTHNCLNSTFTMARSGSVRWPHAWGIRVSLHDRIQVTTPSRISLFSVPRTSSTCPPMTFFLRWAFPAFFSRPPALQACLRYPFFIQSFFSFLLSLLFRSLSLPFPCSRNQLYPSEYSPIALLSDCLVSILSVGWVGVQGRCHSCQEPCS